MKITSFQDVPHSPTVGNLSIVIVGGRLKSTQMTQILWICTDKNEAYETKEGYYQ
jgi:hypothetical protein